MMKNVLWVVSAAVVGVGAYFFLGGEQAPAPRVEQTQPVVETPAPVVVQEEAAAVEETVTTQMEDVIKEAEPQKEAVEEAVTSLVETVKEKAEEAGLDTGALAEQAQTLMTDGAQAARDGAAQFPDYLTFESFDLEKVKDFIEASEQLSSTQKVFLTSAVTQAQESPELLKAALDQLQSALGFAS